MTTTTTVTTTTAAAAAAAAEAAVRRQRRCQHHLSAARHHSHLSHLHRRHHCVVKLRCRSRHQGGGRRSPWRARVDWSARVGVQMVRFGYWYAMIIFVPDVAPPPDVRIALAHTGCRGRGIAPNLITAVICSAWSALLPGASSFRPRRGSAVVAHTRNATRPDCRGESQLVACVTHHGTNATSRPAPPDDMASPPLPPCGRHADATVAVCSTRNNASSGLSRALAFRSGNYFTDVFHVRLVCMYSMSYSKSIHLLWLLLFRLGKRELGEAQASSVELLLFRPGKLERRTEITKTKFNEFVRFLPTQYTSRYTHTHQHHVLRFQQPTLAAAQLATPSPACPCATQVAALTWSTQASLPPSRRRRSRRRGRPRCPRGREPRRRRTRRR